MYSPRIMYELDGENHEFVSGWSSSSPDYQVGDSIKVLVSPEQGREAMASLLELYGIPVFAVLILLMVALITFILQHGDEILQILHPQLR